MIEARTADARRAVLRAPPPPSRNTRLAVRLPYHDPGRIADLRNAKSDGTPLSYFIYSRAAGSALV